MTTTTVISIGTLNVEESSGYAAALIQSFAQPEAGVSRVNLEGTGAVATAVQPDVLRLFLQVYIVTAASVDAADDMRRALMRVLDTSRGPVTVVIENAAGSVKRRRYGRFVVTTLQQAEAAAGYGFVATLESADDIRWTAVEATEDVRSLTTGATFTVTNGGDLDAHPVITLEAEGDKPDGNFVYRVPFYIDWRSDYSGEATIDVTGGGLDTAALLTAGKVSNESNMAVMLNGRLVPFWYGADEGDAGGFNSASTRMWVNVQVPRQVAFTLTQDVSATATTWRVTNDATLPASGLIDAQGEIVSYSSRSPGYLYGVERGLYDSTADEHTTYDELRLVTGVGYILYGPVAAAPATYSGDRGQPMITGSASTNAVWRYDEFADGTRPLAWVRVSGRRNLNYVQASGVDGAYSGSWSYPWTAMGVKPGWTDYSYFYREFPMAIKQVQIVGRRRAIDNPAAAPGAPEFMAAQAGTNLFYELWDAGDGITRTNEQFNETIVLPTDGDYTRLMWRAQPGGGYAQADIHWMIITFHDWAAPIVTVGDEETGYDLDLTLYNLTAGESIRVTLPDMMAGSPLVIDCENQTVTYQRRNVYAAVTQTAVRPRFFRLVPGANQLAAYETGMGDMGMTIRFSERWYA